MTERVSIEMKTKLFRAFEAWDEALRKRRPDHVVPQKPIGNTGVHLLQFFAGFGAGSTSRLVTLCMQFHDEYSALGWETATTELAFLLGPSEHFVALSGWHYMAYDGWRAYAIQHKQAPVDKRGYVLAMIRSHDMAETIKTQF